VPHIREQAMLAIEEADIILFLMDGKHGITPADWEVVDMLRRSQKPIFFIINKVDSADRELELVSPFYELGVEKLWVVSAEHGYGFKDFMDGLCSSPVFEDHGGSGEEEPENLIKVAFFGRPNVGKSSIINTILGVDRMVVSDISGTTRDSVDTMVTKGNYSYLFIDTAGIRRRGKTTEKLEKFSILKSLSAMNRCDVAVVMLDAGEGITEQDTKVIGYVLDAGRALVVLVNKWDLLKGDKKQEAKVMEDIARALPFLGFAPILTVSALTGYGIKRMFPVIGSVFRQYSASFPTSALNNLLRDAVEQHSPPVYKNKRLKFYYTAQIGTKPPKFVVMTNSGKGVHFSYERYLINRYRDGLGLDKVPIKLFFKEKKSSKE
jgi:GTP-binding protein